MSAYTTLKITRAKAQSFIVQELFNADSHELERCLEVFVEDRLYNVIVVPDGSQNDNNEL